MKESQVAFLNFVTSGGLLSQTGKVTVDGPGVLL
jgi:hypothetical protein